MEFLTEDPWSYYPLAFRRRIGLYNTFPKIITLCGSTRFKSSYESITREESLKGNIVISVGLFGHQEALNMSGDIKNKLDELHLRKIDLADEIYVINACRMHCILCNCFSDNNNCDIYGKLTIAVPYIGTSTKNEINYATKINKKIRYMNPVG